MTEWSPDEGVAEQGAVGSTRGLCSHMNCSGAKSFLRGREGLCYDLIPQSRFQPITSNRNRDGTTDAVNYFHIFYVG